MESLRFDLYRMILANAKLTEERDFYQMEVNRLEQQLAMYSNGKDMITLGSTMKSTPNSHHMVESVAEGYMSMIQPPIPPFDSQVASEVLYPSLTPIHTQQINHQSAEVLQHIFSNSQPQTLGQ
jgi:hypothetical protein